MVKSSSVIDETMTCAELIEELQKFPPNFSVITEGCDCNGNCVRVSLYAENEVMIERST